MRLSIVSPIYKGEKMMDELVRRITESVRIITDDYEIILVNDMSPDNSWQEIEKHCSLDKHVKGINLSRNFGQHYAITAGLSQTSGEWVVVMDCDLQDQPEEIPALLKKAREGYDVVFAQRIERKDRFFKKISSTIFNAIFSYLSGSHIDNTVANFGIYHRKVIAAILSMGDSIRSLQTMTLWVGFRRTYLPVTHAKRAVGNSGYNLRKLVKMAADYIIAFSNKPLYTVLKFGFVMFVVSLIVAIFYFAKYLFWGVSVSGFTTLVISLWILSAIQMMLVGVVGLYIAKIFDRVKDRPLFIIDKTINIDNEDNNK